MPEKEMSEKNRDKYSSIRKVICMMIHCIDCDDEDCMFMPYCLDFQDLLVHQEECTDKCCKIRVSFLASRFQPLELFLVCNY